MEQASPARRRRTEESSPARLYAGIVGATLIVAGVIGFFYNSTFTDNESVREAVFGILDVNGWHNVVHILTGLLGVLAFRAGNDASRLYALGIGAVYIVVAIWGFAIGSGDSILGILPINTEDSILHLLLGVGGLGAGLASQAPERRRAVPASQH
jgi:Domain of unknown function (DUF4383)